MTARSVIESMDGRSIGIRPNAEKMPSTISAATTITPNMMAVSWSANFVP